MKKQPLIKSLNTRDVMIWCAITAVVVIAVALVYGGGGQ
jgi:hypothetical protein